MLTFCDITKQFKFIFNYNLLIDLEQEMRRDKFSGLSLFDLIGSRIPLCLEISVEKSFFRLSSRNLQQRAEYC